MRSWLKAGLIGGAAQCALALLNTVLRYGFHLVMGYISTPLSGLLYLLYGATGGLAAYWATGQRTPRNGARAGAQAGLTAAIIALAWDWLTDIVTVATGIRSMLWLIPLKCQFTDIWYATYRWPILHSNPITGSVWFAVLVTLAINTGVGALGGLIVALAKGEEEPPLQTGGGSDRLSS